MKINSYWTQSLVFNSEIPNQHSLLSWTSFYFLKLQLHGRQMMQHISWSQGCYMSPHNSEPISCTFTSGVNCAWQYYQTTKSALASEQFYLLNPLSQFYLQNNLSTSKSKIASFCYNSSTLTLVSLLGILFNTISHFSDHLAYLSNVLQ